MRVQISEYRFQSTDDSVTRKRHPEWIDYINCTLYSEHLSCLVCSETQDNYSLSCLEISCSMAATRFLRTMMVAWRMAQAMA